MITELRVLWCVCWFNDLFCTFQEINCPSVKIGRNLFHRNTLSLFIREILWFSRRCLGCYSLNRQTKNTWSENSLSSFKIYTIQIQSGNSPLHRLKKWNRQLRSEGVARLLLGWQLVQGRNTEDLLKTRGHRGQGIPHGNRSWAVVLHSCKGTPSTLHSTVSSNGFLVPSFIDHPPNWATQTWV